jgi:hypothetical protein
MKNLLALSVLGVTIAATGIVRSESLDDKKYWQRQLDYVNKNLESANRACDAHFTFEFIDKDHLRDVEKTHHTPNSVCSAVIDEVGDICRNEGADGKKAVQEKIKGFQCGFGKPRELDLKGSTVKYMGNNEEGNFSAWAKPWLMKHL